MGSVNRKTVTEAGFGEHEILHHPKNSCTARICIRAFSVAIVFNTASSSDGILSLKKRNGKTIPLEVISRHETIDSSTDYDGTLLHIERVGLKPIWNDLLQTPSAVCH